MDSIAPSVQDVTCQRQNCLNRVEALSTQAATDERARAGGWRVWDGPTHSGSVKRMAVCPSCARTPRQRKAEPEPFDQPLF